MATVAVEPAHEFDARLCALRTEPDVSSLEAITLGEAERETSGGIEPWELHSELVLVCPEVRKLALELLPKLDTEAFLPGPRASVLFLTGTVNDAQHTTSVPAAVVAYAVWRLLETARIALFTVGIVVALSLLAEILH